MPNLLPTPLSELPDFLPLGEPGSDEELACALGTFTDEAANLDFVRLLARLAAQHVHSATPDAGVLAEQAAIHA